MPEKKPDPVSPKGKPLRHRGPEATELDLAPFYEISSTGAQEGATREQLARRFREEIERQGFHYGQLEWVLNGLREAIGWLPDSAFDRIMRSECLRLPVAPEQLATSTEADRPSVQEAIAHVHAEVDRREEERVRAERRAQQNIGYDAEAEAILTPTMPVDQLQVAEEWYNNIRAAGLNQAEQARTARILRSIPGVRRTHSLALAYLDALVNRRGYIYTDATTGERRFVDIEPGPPGVATRVRQSQRRVGRAAPPSSAVARLARGQNLAQQASMQDTITRLYALAQQYYTCLDQGNVDESRDVLEQFQQAGAEIGSQPNPRYRTMIQNVYDTLWHDMFDRRMRHNESNQRQEPTTRAATTKRISRSKK